MSDDTGRASLEEELTPQGLPFETRQVQGLTAVIVTEYFIPRGPYSARRIPLGIVVPADYPSTPPNGIHTRRSDEISARVENPQVSDLGGDWIRWSRVVQHWSPGNRKASLLLAQVDAWLELRK